MRRLTKTASPTRPTTPATRLPADQFVAPEIAQARLERLIELHREIQSEINSAEVGSVVEVLVERRARSHGDMLGRTGTYKVVAFPGDDSLVGRYMHVRINGTTGATFSGVAADVRGGAADAERSAGAVARTSGKATRVA
jgi:tRNA-2-methylthio-N6-dimethylallyladenosine synthase